jgi:hypothetical protein
MVKRTLELFECDRCGKEAQRYSLAFPEEGTLVMDRCDTHAKKLEAFRDEPGEWLRPRLGKQSFHKSSLHEVRLAVEQAAQERKA